MRRLFSTCGCLCLAAACAGAPRPRPEQPVVGRIRVEGNRALSDAELKEKILTSERSWWRFWEEPPTFEPNAWLADRRRIERYYQARGFYEARVVAAEETAVAPDRVELALRLQEGTPTFVSAIEWRGLEALPPAHRRAAQGELPMRVGRVFLEDDWTGAKEQVRRALAEVGYVEAAVEGEVQVDLATHQASVLLEVRPGPRYRFGQTFVATDPNPVVKPPRILEQAAVAIRRGDWYQESALADAQSRVFRMGVFGAVKVNRGAPDRATGQVPIVIDVREAPFHTVRVGGGVGLDQTRNEARAHVEYTDHNFLGGLRRLTARAKVGYAFVPSAWSVLSRQPDAQPPGPFFNSLVEFEQPRALFRDVRAQVSLEAERGIEPAYRFWGGRARAGFIWQPHPAFSIYPSYNLEAYFFDRGTAQLSGATTTAAYGCPSRPCVLSYVEEVVEWDRRNDKAAPRRGYYLALGLQQGGGILGGAYAYLRAVPDARVYWTFGGGEQFTVAARARLGTLANPRDPGAVSPIVSRFFSGGPAMRGFSSRRLSPMALVPHSADGAAADPTRAVAGDALPIGGNGLAEGSLELRYNLNRDFTLAAFFDSGAVTAAPLPLGSPGALASQLYGAVGVGLRYQTMVGPIRLDLARRLPFGPPLPVSSTVANPVSYQSWSGCFGLFEKHDARSAGAPEGPCQFHLAIGEAF